jgi:hypothetical protein
MSDRSSTSNIPPTPPTRRHARRRAGTGASALTKKQGALAPGATPHPTLAGGTPALQAEARDEAREATAADESAKADDLPQDAATPASGNIAARMLQRLTPLGRQILLWGAVFGVLNAIVSLVSTYTTAPYLVSTKAISDHQTFLQGAFCLGTVVSFALLFFAGERATARLGSAKDGGIAGVWSVVVALLLGFVLPYVLPPLPPAASQPTTTAQPAPSTGQIILGVALQILSPLALGFGMGYVGGRYSQWKRAKAKKQQEAAAVS